MSAVAVGGSALAGTVVAGPLGTVVGAALGTAASEALKSFIEGIGEELSDELKPEKVTVDKSMVYLFHAQKALRS